MAHEDPRPAFRTSRRSVLRASALTVPAVLLGSSARGDAALAAPAAARRRLAVQVADPHATQSAIDLAALLDSWSGAGQMTAGQQLNVNGDDPFGPVTTLGGLATRIRVLGWTTNEWDYAVRHEYNEDVLPDLIAKAQASTPTVLVTSWYPHNPRTGAEAHQQPGPKVVKQVLTKGTPERKAFLKEFDTKVAPYLLELQSHGVATIFRPLIEANSFWFWWGCNNSHGGSSEWKSGVRKLFRLVQQRAWSKHGIHNVLWGYSFVPADNYNAASPVSILPTFSDGSPAYDIAGLSSYDFEAHADDTDVLELGSYLDVAHHAPRMALGEVGPSNSNGNWDPHVITSTLISAAFANGWQSPSYGMFWFDDGDPDPTNTDGSWVAGVKQLSSLTGGTSWLATSNADGLINVTP